MSAAAFWIWIFIRCGKSKKICLSNKKMNCSSWKIKQRSNRNSNLVNVKLNFWFFDEWKPWWKLTTSEWNGWINEARPRVFHQSQSRFDPRIQEKLTGKVHIRFTNDHQVSVTFSAISLILFCSRYLNILTVNPIYDLKYVHIIIILGTFL